MSANLNPSSKRYGGCKRCGIGGCDLLLKGCGCGFHTRCFPLKATACPVCQPHNSHFVNPSQQQQQPAMVSIALLPMTFDEIDQAQAEAANTQLSEKRGKKRKNATICRLNNKNDSNASELRTGRWTSEETAYTDQLIVFFERGALPIPDGIKLNDFLSSMLKSKQSRLTKKMKNARLSARQYQAKGGYISSAAEARDFSMLEQEFFASIRCNMERSEIKFHMEKEWRDLFSAFCVNVGQVIDANDWLNSVEEFDRRASEQKDAARVARRREMMCHALHQDLSNSPNGVFIDPNRSGDNQPPAPAAVPQVSSVMEEADMMRKRKKIQQMAGVRPNQPRFFSSAFIGRVVDYMQRHRVPFEHVDAWVPSFVPGATTTGKKQKCRLCFAGCGSTDIQVPRDGGPSQPLSSEEQFDLLSFGEYSQKFSFDVGAGLPGRVYLNDVPSWEQGIHNAPSGLFERKGGAVQWGVQTVLGIPVPSPNVGRVVIVFYSRFDRPKAQDLVNRISDELRKLMPSPRWKLVVDVGLAPAVSNDSETKARELEALVQEHMPPSKDASFAAFLPGFSSLRLLFLKRSGTVREQELLSVALASFEKHKNAGIIGAQLAAFTARDFMNSSRADASGTSSTRTPHGQFSLPVDITASLDPAHPPNNRFRNTSEDIRPDTFSAVSPSIQGLTAGPSPSLHSLSGQHDVPPLNMNSSELAAILQNDAAVNYRS